MKTCVRPIVPTSNENHLHRANVLTFLIVYCLLTLATVKVDLFYYADGAYFAFAVASGHPWELLWSEFPRRLGAMILTGGPASLAQFFGASHTLVGKIYQLTFFAIPIIGMGLVHWLVPSNVAQLWVTWQILFMVTLGMSTFGFPTETWVTLALLLPVIASIVHPSEDRLRQACAFLLASFFCFSHEAAAMCGPALLVAFYKTWQEHDYKVRRYLAFLVTWYILNGFIWVALMAGFQPHNILLVKALQQNQIHLWSLVFLHIPLVIFGIVMTAASFWLTAHPNHLRITGVRLAILTFIALIVLFWLSKETPSDRYISRSAITWAVPLLSLVMVFWRKCPTWKVTQWILLPSLVVHTLTSIEAAAGWLQYRKLLDQHTTGLKIPLGSEWDDIVHKSLPQRAQFYWGWSSPYTLVMLNNSLLRNGVILDNQGWYVPMTCEDATIYLHNINWIYSDAVDSMVHDICTKNPPIKE
jgi:hypothetical protein